MEALGIVPSGSISLHLGLFCTGNFHFGEEQRKRLMQIGDFDWEDVRKVNVKEELLVHLKSGEVRRIPLDQLDFMKRYACHYCGDYAAEFADLSFGGIGAPEGWTTVIVRSPLGRAVMADARGVDLELGSQTMGSQALNKVMEWSNRKKERAAARHQELERRAVRVMG